ncbi:SecDF P1 head subdomain-containing protein [Actinomadura roseirufa]|uniref:SecDF P1 head subdomain-containing protein n=1 Tax=Actinomadura roseirufa TaxID=2094049 RepID=UPI0010419F1B|nr:hypothetical protein [Actinomadura roseirufa]
MLLAGAAAVVLAIAGVIGFLVLRGEDEDPAAGGPVDLREPLTFQEVAATAPAPCAAGMLPDPEEATCYRLGASAMTVRRLERLRILGPDAAHGQSGWRLALTLTRADAAGFGRMSGQAAARPDGSPGRRIAMVAGGRVLSAPAIQGGPITGGDLEISGSRLFTRPYLEDLARRLSGRRAP